MDKEVVAVAYLIWGILSGGLTIFLLVISLQAASAMVVPSGSLGLVAAYLLNCGIDRYPGHAAD